MQATHDIPVLIVEDDTRLQAILVKGLQSCGFPTYAAGSLAGAHEVLSDTTVAFLVIDLGLPDGSGWELVRWARAAGNMQPRTIVITADDIPLGTLPEPDLRPDALLRKPFALDDLAHHLLNIDPSETAGGITGESLAQ